jgi:hypothetical protein
MARLVPSALRDPLTTTYERRPGSVRRTTNVDILAPEGAGVLHLSGGARDLRTASDGAPQVLDQARLVATVGPGRVLRTLETEPGLPGTAALVGRSVGKGFRAALDEALPEERAAQTLLALLLEELPVATLISGYAALYRLDPGAATPGRSQGRPVAEFMPADVCAGWRQEGQMMTLIREDDAVPIPVGPPAPALDREDEWGWHDMAVLEEGQMRRRRLLDVIPGRPVAVRAMFRDTHVQPGEGEAVVHEYQAALEVDPDEGVITAARARADVLPWPECPAAADSAAWLVGQPVSAVRQVMRERFHGTATCTHLNDLLRSVGDVGSLLARLAPAD